jgi:hypothetical protein
MAQATQSTKPTEAVALLAPMVGGDEQAKALLASRFYDMSLKVTAAYMTESADVGPIPNVFVDDVEATLDSGATVRVDRGFPQVSDRKIGTNYVFWESSRDRRINLGGATPRFSADIAKDLKRWDWGAATFVFSRPAIISGEKIPDELPLRLRVPTRMVIYGIRFERSEIEKLAAQFGARQQVPKPSGLTQKRRRQARKYDWTDLYMKLAAFLLVRDMEDVFGVGPGDDGWKAALQTWMETRLEESNVESTPFILRDETNRFRDAILAEKARDPVWDRAMVSKLS